MEEKDVAERALKVITSRLKKEGVVLPHLAGDERLSSAANEGNVKRLIKKVAKESAFFSEKGLKISNPNEKSNRAWYDFSIEGNGIFVPVNIKITGGKHPDNLSCKLGIFYALTGKRPESAGVSNGIGWEDFAIFASKNGNVEFVCSTTKSTGKLKRMYYNIPAPDLLKHKDELLARRVKKCDEDTWYIWGRGYCESEKERLYVNAKTRQSAPFFYNPCKAYDGSVLAIFPKFKADKELLLKVADELNALDWTELGFKAGGRFLFSQRALENTVLPEAFEKYKKIL